MRDKETIAWLNMAVKKYRSLIWVLVLLQIVINGVAVCYALIMKKMIDHAVNGESHGFFIYLISFGLLILLQLALRMLLRHLEELARSGMENALKQRLFDNLMKKEWFFWPLGILMRKLGGIPVYRNKKQGMTDIAAQKALEMDTFRLCITPEGTRKPTTEWKRGFYYIALKANLPILLYGLDYERKLVKCTRTFLPTGNVENDMAEIKAYFKEFTGRHPEKFKI